MFVNRLVELSLSWAARSSVEVLRFNFAGAFTSLRVFCLSSEEKSFPHADFLLACGTSGDGISTTGFTGCDLFAGTAAPLITALVTEAALSSRFNPGRELCEASVAPVDWVEDSASVDDVGVGLEAMGRGEVS